MSTTAILIILVAVALLLVVASILAPLAVISVWTKNTLLDTVRDYAVARLEEAGGLAAAQRRGQPATAARPAATPTREGRGARWR